MDHPNDRPGPVEPPPTPWELPSREQLAALETDDDLVAVGADLAPGTVLAAYRRGIFPMPEPPRLRLRSRTPPAVGWWCPADRGVLRLDRLRVSRSLRRAVRDFEIRVDTVFDEVVAACGDPRRPGAWIDAEIRAAYSELHRLGWAHSVEAWQDGRLAGGLYGVAIGGLFAGESMFYRVRDASKVALVALVERLADEHARDRLIDVQWSTPHLQSLGVEEIPRRAYLEQLPGLLGVPLPAAFAQLAGGGESLPATGGHQ
ncbi:leucyl/phenylalanyl-tRNA--protein transferase [Nocardioides sp. HM23]|uniref:leucyl/phenylalanyl-tRNA--protein transferase n=1 Tax=Nocardioides bizhenqiangii TaxID=3095076 RepID=UPI002ACA7C2C|nr:leucyl/phenylalanyl-tRNA--protein transferase [Nocardioides sp. HM23]MDZ5619554.1 leucyl/phenylalanyl-tRNA--protein transferase [Nocardioides sp. HM23]